MQGTIVVQKWEYTMDIIGAKNQQGNPVNEKNILKNRWLLSFFDNSNTCSSRSNSLATVSRAPPRVIITSRATAHCVFTFSCRCAAPHNMAGNARLMYEWTLCIVNMCSIIIEYLCHKILYFTRYKCLDNGIRFIFILYIHERSS